MAGEIFKGEIKLRVSAETKARINEIASARPRGEGDSESAVIREALREYLQRRPKNSPAALALKVNCVERFDSNTHNTVDLPVKRGVR